MRFITPVLALFAAVVIAQQNAINVPPGGLQVAANTPVTITWTNPSSGTVTIKLQQGSTITTGTGLVLASGIEASDETATFTIPANQANPAQYTFEIIDDTDPSNYNFSPGFTVQGATGTATAYSGTASPTTTETAASSTGTATGTTTGTSSLTTGSSTTGTSTDSSSLPALSSSTMTTMTTSSASSSSASSTMPSMMSTSSEATSSPTAIANNNGAGQLSAHGGLALAILGLIAVV